MRLANWHHPSFGVFNWSKSSNSLFGSNSWFEQFLKSRSSKAASVTINRLSQNYVFAWNHFRIWVPQGKCSLSWSKGECSRPTMVGVYIPASVGRGRGCKLWSKSGYGCKFWLQNRWSRLHDVMQPKFAPQICNQRSKKWRLENSNLERFRNGETAN